MAAVHRVWPARSECGHALVVGPPNLVMAILPRMNTHIIRDHEHAVGQIPQRRGEAGRRQVANVSITSHFVLRILSHFIVSTQRPFVVETPTGLLLLDPNRTRRVQRCQFFNKFCRYTWQFEQGCSDGREDCKSAEQTVEKESWCTATRSLC